MPGCSGRADGSCGDEGRAALSGSGRQLGRGAAGVGAALKGERVRCGAGRAERAAEQAARGGPMGEEEGRAGSGVGLK